MKFLIVFVFCFFHFIGHSQSVSASATKQDWASGICCRTGTNYIISITGDSISLNNLEIHYAIIDGYKFDITQSTVKTNGAKSFSFHFEVSKDRSCSLGINPEETEEPAQYEGCYVKITFENRQVKIPIEPVTELFYLAYP